MTHPSRQNDNAGDGRADSSDAGRLVQIHIEQDPLKRVSPERQHEQNVAIYDLLDENSFEVKSQSGPYHLYLKTDLRHVYFDVRDSQEVALSGFVMALGPFRRIMRDYHMVCTSYYEAIRTKSPSQIQAIDMGRRGLHNEGSELLMQRLENYVQVDNATSRRLFTLIYVMTSRGER